MDGWQKADPHTEKKLPVEVDIPEYMAEFGRKSGSYELLKAIGDLCLVAFYYHILRVGGYTCKGKRNNSKQTKPF